jgi:hypothetical protein
MGFVIDVDTAKLLGIDRHESLLTHIRPFIRGRDLTDIDRKVLVIDQFGLSADEVLTKYPEVYQWVFERVKPERDQNNR